jgi:adenosylcobinamide-GDP ribazoletransferase
MQQYQKALQASVVYFPTVGVLIGMATAGTYGAFHCLWSPLVSAILAIGLEAWLTGAFHEDALADATDALGGGWTREQVLEILKDSRHGTYGVLALVIGVSLRIALISNCDLALAFLAIPLSAGIGRWSILILMNRLEAITDRHTMARDVGSKPSLKTIGLGAIGPVVAFFAILTCCHFILPPVSDQLIWWNAIGGFFLVLLATLLTTWYYARLIQRRVGGVTGDFLGSNCYLVQLVSLMAMQVFQLPIH